MHWSFDRCAGYFVNSAFDTVKHEGFEVWVTRWVACSKLRYFFTYISSVSSIAKAAVLYRVCNGVGQVPRWGYLNTKALMDLFCSYLGINDGAINMLRFLLVELVP